MSYFTSKIIKSVVIDTCFVPHIIQNYPLIKAQNHREKVNLERSSPLKCQFINHGHKEQTIYKHHTLETKIDYSS